TAYIKDILEKLLAGCTDYESLLPHNWVLTHPAAVRAYRVEERRDAIDRRQIARARRRSRRK
ncbi:MAG: IS66 family transposase, partial [Planctomycetota bacterium]